MIMQLYHSVFLLEKEFIFLGERIRLFFLVFDSSHVRLWSIKGSGGIALCCPVLSGARYETIWRMQAQDGY